MIHEKQKGTREATRAHPNLMYGFNPPHKVNLIIADVVRNIFVPTTEPYVFTQGYEYPL